MPDLMLDSLSGQETVWELLIINGIVQMDKTIVRGPTVQLFCSVSVGSVFVCLIENLNLCKSLVGYEHYDHNLPYATIQLRDSFHENLAPTL